MSAINVDRIAPKHSASIRIDMTAPIVLQPTTVTLSGALTDTGSIIAFNTVTGTLICDGDIVYIDFAIMSFTSVSTTYVTSPLLVGTDFIPTTTKYIPIIAYLSATNNVRNCYIDTTGLIHIPCNGSTIIFPQVVKYSIH